MKIIWIDTETTGLVPGKHGIYQLAYIVEIDGDVKEEGELLFNPGPVEFTEEALKVNGRTKEEIENFQEARFAKASFQTIMSKYVDKYNKADKFIPAGYNINFDLNMMRAWWESLGDKYFGSWFDYHSLDVMAIGMVERYFGRLALPNHKLETLCTHYGIQLKAHDAINDIRATRELFLKMADNR